MRIIYLLLIFIPLQAPPLSREEIEGLHHKLYSIKRIFDQGSPNKPALSSINGILGGLESVLSRDETLEAKIYASALRTINT